MEGVTEDLYRSYRALDADANDVAAFLFARAYLRPALAAGPAGRILEVGCGTGATMRALRRLGFPLVEGVDSSLSQVEEARRQGTEVRLADGSRALREYEPGTLAAVLALDVLEHLEDAELLAWLGLCAERLMPGGLVAVRVPNGDGLFGASIVYGDFTHRRAFNARSLKQLFILRGLDMVAVRGCRPLVHGVPSALRAAAWVLIETIVRFASFAESGRADHVATRNIFAVARRPA